MANQCLYETCSDTNKKHGNPVKYCEPFVLKYAQPNLTVIDKNSIFHQT